MRIRLIKPWSGMAVGRATTVPGELGKRLVDQHIANEIELPAPPAGAPEPAPESARKKPAAQGRKRR